MNVPLAARLAVLGILAAACAGGAVAARARYLPAGQILPGLRVDGQIVSDPADLPALVHTRVTSLAARKMKLVLPGEPDRPVLEVSLGDLGLAVDEAAVVRAAQRVGHEGDLLERADAAERAAAGAIDVPLLPTLDDTRVMPLMTRIKETEDSQPVSARLDLDRHTTVPEKPGRYLDAHGAFAALEQAARDPDATVVTIPAVEVEPRITTSFVAALDVHTVISEYETYFSRAGDQQRRGKNIDVAAAKLDGLVLSPGELLSFNQLVGERSEENGFQKSWEIFKGEMIEGIGGGTCQAASTFHAVAFFGGLEIVERLPHSRPSAYIPMGLDSTVVYPIVDLKVRNPHSFPVVLHAKTEGNKLRMELLGPSRPVRVAFGRELLKTVPYPRKIVEQPMLAGKKVVVKQHGIRGFRIKRSRILTFPDGTHRTETNTDFYPPTTEIYEVPVDFDVALLPPLPHADGDEGEGSDSSAQTAAAAAATTTTTPTATPTATAAPPATTTTTTTPTATTSTTPTATTPTATPDGQQAVTDLQLVDGPGSHAPTKGQANPAKTIWVRR